MELHLTGESGRVSQFAFTDIGEERQLGVILCDVAALAYVTSSTLENKIPENNAEVKTDSC